MKTLIAVAGVAALSLALSACSTSGSADSATALIRALGDVYDHCERQVTYNLAIGPMNPGSGANVAGTVRCPAKVEAAPPAAATAGPKPLS